MEVHAHTHPSTGLPTGQTGSGPRKKWTHYFWEFLMFFLAVFSVRRGVASVQYCNNGFQPIATDQTKIESRRPGTF